MPEPPAPTGRAGLREAVRAATDALEAAGVPSAAVDAALLAASALGVDASEVRRRLAVGGTLAPDRYADLVAARVRRVPLQHLTGAAPFRGLTLAVGPGVFVPRPETEVLVDHVLHALDVAAPVVLEAMGDAAPDASSRTARVDHVLAGLDEHARRSRGPLVLVDLATGSGAIAFAVKSERPATTVHAVEQSPRAHAWAERNRTELGLDVHLELGDARTAFEPLRGTVDVVSANPPYLVPGADPLDPEVADHEPALALFGGGPDGLDLPLALAARAAALLRPGGRLVLEHGPKHSTVLRDALAETGEWSAVEDHPDLAGRPRVLVAVRGPDPRPSAPTLASDEEGFPMTEVFDCNTAQGRADGVAAAVDAVTAGGLVVLPTDTVYGVGCDAFAVDAVQALLAAKGRGRSMPPPVLVPNVRTVDGLARDVPDYARALIERYWPGALTLVLRAQSSLSWDLGDTNGTVGLRMPADEVALQLLHGVGPLAVTSANRTAAPPATTVVEAREQLGDSVAVYLDAGPRRSEAASTVLDCTGQAPVVLRQGALPAAAVDRVVRRVLDVRTSPPTAGGVRRGPRVAGSRRRP